MADAGQIARLRENIGDTDADSQAYTDPELAQLLDENGGIEPRARVAALLPLWAEAAGRTDYTSGTASEKASQAFAQLRDMMGQAQADVAALDAQGRVMAAAQGVSTMAIPVAVSW